MRLAAHRFIVFVAFLILLAPLGTAQAQAAGPQLRAEIDYDKVTRVRGMDITIVTSAGDDVAARRLLELLGLPLRKPKVQKVAVAA
jgi:hypothetical protein